MTTSIVASHSIVIDIPVRQCQMLFTPAGEELWVDGWQPKYMDPCDGRTVQGMFFATGSGDETTVWFMTEFTRAPYRARYARVTPASRWGFVDVECKELDEHATHVQVTYQLYALTTSAEDVFKNFEPKPFIAMINEWKRLIDAKLEILRDAKIR
jgi:hypothetical protein